MIVKAKPDENIRIRSMGKHFRIRAIADTDAEANNFCRAHRDTGVIACMGSLVFIADFYEGKPG